MNSNEKQFEDFVSNIKFDDAPNPDHRDKLEQSLLTALDKQGELECSPLIFKKLKARIKNRESLQGRSLANPLIRKIVFRFAEVAAIVALTLFINHLFHEPARVVRDDTATIKFYIKEHQNVVARTASLNPSPPQPAQMNVSRHDILYYEFFDDQPEYIRPGIILRGPSSQHQISPPKPPAISNGHTLTLSEARRTATFDLVSPPWLDPGYMFEQIRRIEGRDALHLLYTDGINTLSLFEQPLDGQRGLEPQDFREYAVYRNKGQAGGTILAWRDDVLSYVLIGNAEMPQLMDMAQSISAANERK